ncbi:MAG: DUF4411 family protein [Truepera sp.]|nr:DUF4411 family protein [Truepera sp.]
MYKYCLDTSAISNPLLEMPEDIYVSLWPQLIAKIESGVFCWNAEIGDELALIFGKVGDCLKSCKGLYCREVGDEDWPWRDYIETVKSWRATYYQFISEYNGDRKNTIGLNDLSIVALAKTLWLPVVSMEKRSTNSSLKKLRIPDLCDKESIEHLSFNEFLKAEGITV